MEGAPKLASEYSTVPVVNGGDGGHQHPTQTLTDLITIKYYKKDVKNLKIALCGDLLFGRTVHSLLKTLSRFENISFYLISPPELKIPKHLKNDLLAQNISLTEVTDLEDCVNDVDILYMTRIQKERFLNEEEYMRLKDSYVLTRDKLDNAKEDLLVMHPLPRVNEIQYDVDDDPRAKFFQQAELGVYVRMALISYLLGVADHA